jgi:rhodanese-related sulfurtransferase
MSSNIISLGEIRSLLERGRPLNILDVRTPAEFARVHVLGARLMPLDDLDPAAVAAERPSAADPIYVICQSGGRASKACQRLQEAGVAQVYSIEGGTAAWEKMGLPVERGGRNVISLERQVRIGAGLLVLIGTTLALTVHSGFLVIPVFVGAGLVFAGITDYCGMALVLGRMPWNR